MSGERKTYKVFISSTYLDNAERRKLVEDAVLRANMQPVGMERFTASINPTVDECERQARECDLYVGQWDNKQTAPVGSFAPNPFGLHDLLGNVWEWVEDCWHHNYEGAPSDGSAWGEEQGGDCNQRVIRGGSWYLKPQFVRSATRLSYTSDFLYYDIGFRLAQDI